MYLLLKYKNMSGRAREVGMGFKNRILERTRQIYKSAYVLKKWERSHSHI